MPYMYMYSFISNNYLPDVAVAYSKRYPQLLGNGKLCLETGGGADLQCILSLFCSPKTDRARFQRLCPIGARIERTWYLT